MRHKIALALSLLGSLCAAGCGGGGGGSVTPPANPTITSVSVSCSPITITTAQTSTCMGTVHKSDGSSDSEVTFAATGGTITAAGIFTPAGVGSAKVTATSTEDTSVTSAPETVTVTAIPLPTPTITATPATITVGQSVNVVWNGGNNAASVSVSGPGLTTSTALTGSVTVTPPATGKADYVITATGPGGTVSATAEVIVNAPAPTATLTASTTSAASGSSLTLTLATTNATSCTASSTDNSWTGTVPCNEQVTVTPTAAAGTTVTYSVTATGSGGSVTASTNPITITPGAIELDSISPRAQWCVGKCLFLTFTLHGKNFEDGDEISCSPDPNIQVANFVSSQELTILVEIDSAHEGSGDRLCKVQRSDGSQVTGTAPFGLYSQNMCGVEPNGERRCLNSGEIIDGQNLFDGQPLNGYVDEFSAYPDGTLEGNFFVGAPSCCIVVNDATGFISVNGGIYDQSGGVEDVPTPQGFYPEPVVGVATENKYECIIQPTAPENLSCVSITGPIYPPPTVMSINVGTGTQPLPQSLGMATINGKTFAFVLTVGTGGVTLWSVDVSDGMTQLTSQPVAGITAGAPGGSSIVTFDALGIGLITSYGDNIAIPFSETTLKLGESIPLPGLPINAIADSADGVAIIGNANATSAGGTFVVVDPVKGTATAIANANSPALPTGITVTPAGGSFSTCPNDGTACSNFVLP